MHRCIQLTEGVVQGDHQSGILCDANVFARSAEAPRALVCSHPEVRVCRRQLSWPVVVGGSWATLAAHKFDFVASV